MSPKTQPTPVLLAVSEFPLNGGTRINKFANLLPQFGCDPTVVCARETTSATSLRAVEASKPHGATVVHARSLGWSYFAKRFLYRGRDARHYRLLKALSWPERCLYVPDFMVRWVPDGIRVARDLVVKKRIPVVLTSSPHESTHLIGLVLKRQLGVRWVADFRDLWTTKRVFYYPATRLHDRWIKRLERYILHQADHVVANTEENKALYVHTFGLDPARVSVIPNGFDRADLDDSFASPRAAEFRLGYMGSLDKHDFPWKLVLTALEQLADRVGRDNVRLVHCGFCSPEVDQHIRDRGIDDLVIRHGTLTHREAMHRIAATDVRLVMLYENEYSGAIVPSKLYNYLIMNGPVLAVAPERGAVARILAETRMGVVISPTCDPERLLELMRRYYDDWKRGELRVTPDEAKVSRYDRRRHVEELAGILCPPENRALSHLQSA